MPKRAKTICPSVGCNNLVDTPGYCDKHKEETNPFRALDKKKTPEMKKFYSSGSWTKTSKNHRKKFPLCGRCLERGKTKSAEMVHHEPPLEELLRKGLNPHNEEYLNSLCDNCHLEDLREKKTKNQ